MAVNFCICRAAPADCPIHAAKKRSKYGSKETVVDGIRFASRKEANYYSGLLLAQKSGDLLFFLRQVPLHLQGGVIYRLDFCEFWKNGEMRFVDVKGFKTPTYRLKKRQVEACYPIKITEA